MTQTFDHVTDAAARAVLNTRLQDVGGNGTHIPISMLWELYSAEFLFERLYERLVPLLFTSGLRSSKHETDEAFFDGWRHHAFELSHRTVAPLDNGVSTRAMDIPTYCATLTHALLRNSGTPVSSNKYGWWQRPRSEQLVDRLQEDIDRLPEADRPNIYNPSGSWLDLLGNVVDLCVSLPTLDTADTRYDYDLEPDQALAITDMFAWLKEALDFEPVEPVKLP